MYIKKQIRTLELEVYHIKNSVGRNSDNKVNPGNIIKTFKNMYQMSVLIYLIRSLGNYNMY